LIGNYTVVIDTACLEVLFGSSRRHRQVLLRLFDSLASNPHQKGEYIETSPAGREYQIGVAPPFIVTYWADHAVQQVQIVKIILISGRRQ
jgi:hypothetical protein